MVSSPYYNMCRECQKGNDFTRNGSEGVKKLVSMFFGSNKDGPLSKL
jgi:hypothetical protein